VNPFQLGIIGSTDTHLGAPGMVDEDRFRGHAAGNVSLRWGVQPYPDRPDFNPGGLAVLWAEENSRDALFEAMRRREAYGTSGPAHHGALLRRLELSRGSCAATPRSRRRVMRAACRWAASLRRRRGRRSAPALRGVGAPRSRRSAARRARRCSGSRS
jgi:hypothetical protein